MLAGETIVDFHVLANEVNVDLPSSTWIITNDKQFSLHHLCYFSTISGK